MKYPKQQFNELCESLVKVKEVFNGIDLNSVNPGTLHFFVYSQNNFDSDNANVKFINGERMFDHNDSFLLYPEGCNDNHIETAIKQAIKIVSK